MQTKMKILAVDDEERVLLSIKKVINSKHPDFKVDFTSTPNKCLEMITDNIYDLIISDLLMPDLNGFELMNKIRKIVPNQKIIIITGYPTLKNYSKALQGGACNFIPKPYTRDELLTAIYLLF